ncbi:MAG: tetratricopeptide (TPR) repeat protein [Myxococcota bacterium]|jgi:tetratricopeptide (TPR) repeat protein
MNLLLLLPLVVIAQEAEVAEGTLEEQMRAAHDESRYITARRLAEELLAADPENLNGLYVMGRVQWLSEGDHARALHYLKEADRVYRSRYDGIEDRPWKIHSEILFATQNVAEELGDYGYQLVLMDEYDDRFDPPFDTAERAWAYMREDDLPAARRSAQAGIDSEDTWQQVIGHNAMCAIESALGDRMAGLQACRTALDHRRDYGQGSLSVAAGNAAGAAISALDFEQAEEWAREGTSGGNDVTVWRRLILMMLNQGRTSEAVEALRELRRSQSRMEPSMRDLRRADIDASFARLLLVAGETDRGLAVISRALQYPDRRGLISTDEDQARGGHSLLRQALRRTHRQRLREQNAARGLLSRVAGWLRLSLPDPALWADDAAIRGALSDRERLLGTMRIYLDDGLNDAPPWLVGDIIDIIGAGVAEAALAKARAAEDLPGMTPYYTSFEAEIALSRRQHRDALRLAEEALAGLPQPEVLARARAHGVAARAGEKLRQQGVSLQHLGRLMQLDPGTARRMGLALPVTISASGSGLSGKVGRALGRSPRFTRRSAGFQVDVDVSDVSYRLCLRSALGDQLACAEGDRPRTEDEVPVSDREYIEHVATAFHDRAFAMPLGLSSVDLNSLDGTTSVRSEEERARLQGVLDEL